MSEEEQKLIEEAERYIKDHKRELIARFADTATYLQVECPISLFMAGSPGAGKTEASKRLITQFADTPPVRIDADEIRALFPGYTGANSHLFQRACTIGVHRLFNHVLDKKLNAILDGTFGYEGAMENIERSLKRGRDVVVYYVFQDPAVAWEFTRIREAQEGRRVPKDVFISAFIRARDNVEKAKVHFGDRIELHVTIKDFTRNFEQIFPDVSGLDPYLPKRHTKEELENLL